jgi:TetR/AcrR family transcriptional regulator, regulator of autoinduction and epiphytic fitness
MRPPASPERSRRYHSPIRQEQARSTRRAILAAATEKFSDLGYAGATMDAIAAAAGVSVPTVELAFATKATLLKAAIDVAIVGDDEPIAVLERPWAARAQEATTPEAFLAVVADVLVEAAKRADALVLVAFEAARSDQRVAPLVEQLKAQRSVTAAWIVDGLVARSAPSPGIDRGQAIDIVWLLMDPAVFYRLTSDRGWNPERFGAWFADSALCLLTRARIA